jgi:nucleoid-associated protein YgaU
MTSDAKIGLLLGLVFIFVIAFIINGLPNLRPQSTKAEQATNTAQDQSLGLADREQKAQETISWDELMENQPHKSPAPELTPVVKNPESATPKPESVVATDSAAPGSRFASPLTTPGSLERLTKGLEDIVGYLAEASAPAAGQKTTEPAPIIETPKPTAKLPRAQATETATVGKLPVTLAASVGRTYIVADGENLASVAKRAYGPEEGNRIVNIQRIYEANRNILKSPDEVRAGQELVIPPAEKPKTVQDKLDAALPKTLFERVESIGKKNVTTAEKKEPEKKREPAVRWYVVQEDDNLWKIASMQLGSGARYAEILKLNGDVLKDEHTVNVGTKLRLPAK